jgi:transposase InsO family protein
MKLLEEFVRRYGKPDQILTDRGPQFYPARGGVSEFTEFCTGNGIEHIVASVRRPSTIGKVEPSIRRTSTKPRSTRRIKHS